jgi:hypothetical protein
VITRRKILHQSAALVGIFIPSISRADLIDPKSPSESMLYCTSRILSKLKNNMAKSGTGFIFSFSSGGRSVPVLITNNHVIDESLETTFRIHTRTSASGPPDGNQDIVGPSAASGNWVSHPDKNIDLCGLPIGGLVNAMKPAPFFRSLDSSIIPSDEQLKGLDAIEEVVMVGYPIGLADTVNNYPVMRRGITATDPSIDFEGKAIFVVDMASFPGSSGSPVFLYNVGSYAAKSGGTTIGSRLYFLGIMYATPVYTPDGKVQITEAPTTLQGSVNLQIPINLGYVIKAREIAALGKAIFQKYGLPG